MQVTKRARSPSSSAPAKSKVVGTSNSGMDTLLRCKEFEKFLSFFSSVIPDRDREILRHSSKDTRMDLMMMYFGKLCSTLLCLVEEQKSGFLEELEARLAEREHHLDIALRKISEQETVLERAQMANVQLNQELKLTKTQAQAESEKVLPDDKCRPPKNRV